MYTSDREQERKMLGNFYNFGRKRNSSIFWVDDRPKPGIQFQRTGEISLSQPLYLPSIENYIIKSDSVTTLLDKVFRSLSFGFKTSNEDTRRVHCLLFDTSDSSGNKPQHKGTNLPFTQCRSPTHPHSDRCEADPTDVDDPGIL